MTGEEILRQRLEERLDEMPWLSKEQREMLLKEMMAPSIDLYADQPTSNESPEETIRRLTGEVQRLKENEHRISRKKV